MRLMKLSSISVIACAVMIGGVASHAIGATMVVLSDDFTGSNGNLVGTSTDTGGGSWSQTSKIATSPIQGFGNQVAMGNTGQDVFAAFTQSIADQTGLQLHTSMDINVSAAQG